ncbi:MAG: DUF3047 domain-containing protein [Candidatus Omnitrophica bacterium]|nr:DUF3047 domain-containing protein [Candidatus Omnitrophota bacterium]
MIQLSKFKSSIAIFILLAALLCSAHASIVYLRKFDFNDSDALDKWGKMILNGQVQYMLMKYGKNGFVEAQSDKTCSAIYYKIGFKPKDYPLLSWKWKVLKFPDLSQAKTDKERNDYAARVYVIFPFLCFSSSKFIEYVWSEDMPVGSVYDSPEGNNIKMIVARSGKVDAGQWVCETRNVYDDYLKAFGKEPSMSVGAVAIMCDADGSKSSAEAIFDDIAIGNEEGMKRRID